MDLAEARAHCPDLVAVERAGKMTCAHISAPYCNHPKHFFCVFYQPFTGGVARRIDEPAAVPHEESQGECDPAKAAEGSHTAAGSLQVLDYPPPRLKTSLHQFPYNPAPGGLDRGHVVGDSPTRPSAAGYIMHDHLVMPGETDPSSPYGPCIGCPACIAAGLVPPAESPAVLVPEAPAVEPPDAAPPDGERARRPRLSVSANLTFSTCRRKYKLSYIDRWRPRLDPQALVISRLFDRGLQPIIQTGSWNPADLAMTDEDREIIGTDGLDKLYASLDGFRDHATLKPKHGVCQYRVEFAWCGERAIGFLDYWDQGRTVWEFKFTTEVEVCPARYKLQMAIYARATGAQRIIYYPIRKPELQRKKTESSDQFAQRIRDDIARRPGHYYLPREYQPSELWVYLDDLTPLQIHAALENGKSEDFPHNWTACEYFSGCEFQPICQSGGLIDDALFVRKT